VADFLFVIIKLFTLFLFQTL